MGHQPSSHAIFLFIERFVPSNCDDEFLAALSRQEIARNNVGIRPMNVHNIKVECILFPKAFSDSSHRPPIGNRIDPLKKSWYHGKAGMVDFDSIDLVTDWYPTTPE